MIQIIIRSFTLLLICVSIATRLHAQPGVCIFKDTLFNIDFGSAEKMQEFGFNSLRNYRRAFGECPQDGYFSYASYTHDCFNRDWITLNEDHTPGDAGGKMMFVNASNNPGLFFNLKLSGFEGNSNYEFGTWLLNVCRPYGGCAPLLPDIEITLETIDGSVIAKFTTGTLLQIENPRWKKYVGFFRTPANATTLILKMADLTPGGCGNDFAMDDIMIRECYKPEPVITPKPKVEAKVPPVIKVPVKKITNTDKPLQKISTAITKLPVPDTSKTTRPIIKSKTIDINLPKPIVTRENPVVKEIETIPGDLLIELYDNAEIDGDTVSVYHNNQLVISKAGLSEKPITLHIKVDEMHPHHELIMVAENLGSIPPNTSLMIVTVKDKRYEIFISSTEQKNAKVVIDLK